MIRWLFLDTMGMTKGDKYMKKIRRNIFESNSSSTHSLTMVMKSEYDKWIFGELVYDKYDDKLVPVTNETKEDEDYRYLTYEQFHDWEYHDFDTFTDEMTTPSGEKVVAFGYYGYD